MDINSLFQLAPPLVLLLALNVVGLGLKRSPVPDWLIVWILPGLGAALYPQVADWTGTASYHVKHVIVLNALYGVAIGGLSVWGNQLLRQTMAGWKGKNDASQK